MKKKKMSLGQLKVESFVTTDNGVNTETVKGGTFVSQVVVCIQTINGCFSRFNCPSRLICPSVVDGCPSTPAPCTIDTITDTIGTRTLTDTIQTPGGF